ncbi:MAG: hypothetical protein D6766_00755 [Verrucomicrobia bacterium]|nr:MAG: hypothetical protein D6766_00755 [Verrucomicrobiota bacterium]
MGGRLCAFGWVAAFLMWFFSVLTWGNEPVRLEDWEEEEYEPPGAPGAGARIGGAVMGMVKAACVVVTLIAVLAIIPGGLTRFADLRRSVLEESVTGVVTQIYWYKLTPESDEAAGRSS